MMIKSPFLFKPLTSMQTDVKFDLELIKKYNISGPRYTSYPTAVVFNESYKEAEHRLNLEAHRAASADKPLSLYFHIPFCDTLCFFCACNKIASKKREKADVYLDHLAKEMAMQSDLMPPERVVQQLHFGGGTPTFLTEAQMQRMWQLIDTHFNLTDDVDRDYSIEIDPRSVTPDSLAQLHRLGFNRYSLGVQDVQHKVQAAVNRIQPIDITAAVVEQCRNNNAKSINIDLIYGLPLQTVESFADTLQAILKMAPDRLSVFNYAHLPHLFSPQKRINAEDLPSAAEKLDILELTIETLTGAGYRFIGMDHFARPDDELSKAQDDGSLHRNFQGYTTHAECDLLAMGVSAISHINNAFSQNLKTLEGYYHQVNSGHIPIWRGYALDRDDLTRKHIIQQLACHFSLDFKDIESRFELDFNAYFATEMAELEPLHEDALIELDAHGFSVTGRGRLLIRNVCMVFDKYLRKQTQQKFSKVI